MRFLCFELYRGKPEDYKDINRVLADELGLVPMVWGTDENEKHEAWKLPARLLFAETELDEMALNKVAMDIIKSMWAGDFRSIVINAVDWNGEIHTSPKSSVPKMGLDRVEIGRQS